MSKRKFNKNQIFDIEPAEWDDIDSREYKKRRNK